MYLLPKDPEVKELRIPNVVWQEAREQTEMARLPRLLRDPRWHTFQVSTKLVAPDRLWTVDSCLGRGGQVLHMLMKELQKAELLNY